MVATVSLLAQVTEVRQSPAILVVAVLVALITAGGAIISPLLVARRLEKNRIKEKATEDQTRAKERLADFDRTEAVREMAAEAASLLAKQNVIVAESSRDTHDRLEVIHSLVNSSLTAALQGQFDALQELVVWKDEEGRPVSKQARATLRELATILTERKKLQEESDKTND
jgi:hypothetical protein